MAVPFAFFCRPHLQIHLRQRVTKFPIHSDRGCGSFSFLQIA
jgi:hypothetical protein